MLQSLLKVSLPKPGREMILYESTLDICSCIRWAESMFAKRIWTLYILCIFNLQRIEENRDKQEEPAWRSFNLKKRKKSFKGKNPSQVKSLLLHINFRCLMGRVRKSYAACPLLQAPQSSQQQPGTHAWWGKKSGRLGDLEPHNSDRN